MAQEDAAPVVPATATPRLPSMAELTHPVIKVGDREIDLKFMPSFTLRDRKKTLELGCPMDKIGSFTPDQEGTFVLYLLQRLDKKVTQDEVDDLPNPVVQDIIWVALCATREVNRPFSPRSTASPSPTDGAAAK